MIDVNHILAQVVPSTVKVPLHIVEARRSRMTEYLQQHAYAPLQQVCAEFSISEATARRDLAVLAAKKQIVRTYGGALTEYTQRFPSFREREKTRARAKRRMAAAARELIQPGFTCFFDLGTTIFALAGELKRNPVRDVQIVTNSLPVAELLAGASVRVWLLGGELLPRQSALFGGPAAAALNFHRIDLAFMCAEGADAAGVWNSQAEVVALQQNAMQHAARSILCLDGSKIGRAAPVFFARWSQFNLLITDAPLARLRDLGTCERHIV